MNILIPCESMVNTATTVIIIQLHALDRSHHMSSCPIPLSMILYACPPSDYTLYMTLYACPLSDCTLYMTLYAFHQVTLYFI